MRPELIPVIPACVPLSLVEETPKPHGWYECDPEMWFPAG